MLHSKSKEEQLLVCFLNSTDGAAIPRPPPSSTHWPSKFDSSLFRHNCDYHSSYCSPRRKALSSHFPNCSTNHSEAGTCLFFFFARRKGQSVTLVTQTKLPALKPPADCRPTPDGPMAPGCPHLVAPSCSPATKRTPLRRHMREDSSISCTRLLEHCL